MLNIENLILRIDKRYKNTNNWKNPSDEFNKFFRFDDNKGITNVPGFRPKSRSDINDTDITKCAFCILVTTFSEHDWPDELNPQTGIFTYYGDNKEPGASLENTPVKGNKFLAHIYNQLHINLREDIQPILCFQTLKIDGKSYMRFLGLAAPGARGLSATEDLVAIWKVKNNQRFQNYRSTFTILNEELIHKDWLVDLVSGIKPHKSEYCPESWKYWIKTGIYDALECNSEIRPRTENEQFPQTPKERFVLDYIKNNLTDREFEFACPEILKILDANFKGLYVTPRTKDKGRDVIGKYYLGHLGHQIILDVSIEAKHWKGAVGVKPMTRLISRLKRSDIGIFITTSHFAKQVQEELIEDNRPVMLICGGDIARLLIKSDLSRPELLKNWINLIKEKAELDN